MIPIDFGFSPWWLVPGAIVSGLAAWWLYRSSRDTIPAWASMLLTGLRFVVILFLFFLLLGPLLNSISRHENLPVIAVLQDDTESLTVQRDSAFIKNEFPAKLKSFLAKFDADKYKIEFHPFAQKLEESSAPDSLTFSQAGTNISGAMDEVRKQYANQNLGAIVLLSDGISTSGANPLYQAEEIHHPVFTVLLGDTSEQKDISIPTILVNEIAYIDVQTPIQVRIHSNGYENTNLKVNIEHKGKLLEQRDVVVSKSNPDAEVTFIIKPQETGIQQYAVTVSQQPDEITYRNNSKLIFLNVLENRIKIALFAGSAHPDLSAIREPILNDKRYELLEFVHKTRTDFYENPDRFNFKDFDLVILHNFPFGNSDAGIISKIVDEVKNRNLPVMDFSGIFTDLKTSGPLFDLLGLAPNIPSENYEEAQVKFQPAFAEHSSYTFDEGWIRIMNQAPPLLRNRSDWRAKPETKVFGTATIKNVQLDYPIFALQQSLGRKNMVFVGENFWRLRTHVATETGNFAYFDAWILNTIQWLVVKDDKRKFKVFPIKPLFSGSEQVIFRGEVYDDNYNAMKGAEIKLKVTSPDKKELDYYLNESGEAHYFLEVANLGEGTYSYFAEGKKNGLKLGEDRGQFSIGKSNIEHFNLRADKNMLEQMALRTGGTFTDARNLDKLADEIMKVSSLKPVIDLHKSRKGINELTWALVALIVLLTTEWVVRKVYSLI